MGVSGFTCIALYNVRFATMPQKSRNNITVAQGYGMMVSMLKPGSFASQVQDLGGSVIYLDSPIWQGSILSQTQISL